MSFYCALILYIQETLKKHYNLYSGFTHYRDYRAFLFGNVEVVDISYCMSHAPKAVKEVAIYVSDNFADAVTHLENLLDL